MKAWAITFQKSQGDVGTIEVYAEDLAQAAKRAATVLEYVEDDMVEVIHAEQKALKPRGGVR